MTRLTYCMLSKERLPRSTWPYTPYPYNTLFRTDVEITGDVRLRRADRLGRGGDEFDLGIFSLVEEVVRFQMIGELVDIGPQVGQGNGDFHLAVGQLGRIERERTRWFDKEDVGGVETQKIGRESCRERGCQYV